MKCDLCGASITFATMASGHRIAVDTGTVLVASMTEHAGISMGRLLHWQTCPMSRWKDEIDGKVVTGIPRR